jgi:hypothetical protein
MAEDKEIRFSDHAMDQINDRGTSKEEVSTAIRGGEEIPAKRGRKAYRKNFPFESYWKGRYYSIKQVMPIVREEVESIMVITVYVFYIGEKK